MNGRTALLMMDLQTAIVARYAEQEPGYLRRVGRAVSAARSADAVVIWVAVRFRPGYPEISPRNRTFSAIRERGGMALDDASAALHPDLDVRPEDVVVEKRRVGAFSGSDLDVVLRAGGIDHLVLGGIATSGVVLSTVRLAADLDYAITVLEDACLDADPEVHRVLTEKVFRRQAEVLSVDAWAASLASAR
jgi:nicotinamidase-related amidase